MKFTFRAWEHGGPGARKMAQHLQRRADRNDSKLLRTFGSSGYGIDFLVVDIMPTKGQPRELEEALARLIASGSPLPPEDETRIARFLFAGSSPSLDQWEIENDKAVSTKKSVELYIRALQSADLAHYGRGGSDIRHLSDELADSAIISLARFYSGKKGKGQGERLRSLRDGMGEVRQGMKRLFKAARKSHASLGFEADDCRLLRIINAFFQLGKRSADQARANLIELLADLPPERSHKAQKAPKASAAQASPSAYGLWERLSAALEKWGKSKARTLSLAAEIADSSLGLERYNQLRDLGRCIGSGAIDSLRKARGDQKKRGVLIIDDRLCEKLDQPPSRRSLRTGLRDMFTLIDWAGNCYICGAAPFEARSDESDSLADDEILQAGLKVRALEDGRVPAWRPKPEDFSLILVEVDSKDTFLGPRLVHRIDAYLTKAHQRGGERGISAGGTPPPIIVLTRTESFGHIQQSLNFGAVAYVLKERLYQLPYQMHHALNDQRPSRNDTPHASSFRALHALKPEIRAKLHHASGTGFVHGGHTHRDRELGWTLLPDKREENWIRGLPKADLHCHLGTCISYPAIYMLALNTVGHKLAGKRLRHQNAGLRETMATIVLAVVLAEYFHARSKGSIPVLVCLSVAAAALGKTQPDSFPTYGIGNEIIQWLTPGSEKIATFETVALLTAAMGCGEADGDHTAPFIDYIKCLAALEADLDEVGRDKNPTPRSPRRFDRKAALGIACVDAAAQMVSISKHWNGADTKRYYADLSKARTPWQVLADGVERRVGGARKEVETLRTEAWRQLANLKERPALALDELGAHIARAMKALGVADLIRYAGASLSPEEVFQLPEAEYARSGPPDRKPLQDYVQLPVRTGRNLSARERGLQRYLWGADFLGADYLQYPENLVIAAYSLTRDNARDNVTYAEVRCETPGYCHGGLNPEQATDLLCRGFDLASLYLALNGEARRPLPLVRTNVLLAAKRHKGESAARQVVSLVEHYLRLRRDRDDRYWAIFPDGWWWQPSRVVGFDISGDEAKSPEWLDRVLEPLARLSSPITIHAGEAATAESIWKAVHRYHARRVGHGLRLREDERLQDYCVSEGICMEMCPNSNIFTNAYYPRADGKFDDADSNAKNAYPLRGYMQAGLEVCLATDNRYLHRDGSQTLTTEFMAAARLSNGLTRWEILQLVKAGFKNAFLPKQEVKALVSAMEERIYRMTSRGWF